MKFFVTGVAGFLGSHLAERLLAMGHDVAGVDNLIGGETGNIPDGVEFSENDCCDFDAMKNASRGCEVVFHCAATAYEGLSVFSPALVCRNIVHAATSVFSAAIENRARRIVHCSSMARYGTNEVPFRESYEPRPQDPYGIFKVSAEEVLKNLCEVHGVEYAIAVPHNIIGPRQKFDDPYRNVASIMINLMLQNRRPVIYGDGEQKRCFSFVEECVDCLVKMAAEPMAAGQVINIGPDAEFVTINHLCATIAKMVDFPEAPIYLPGRPQEVRYATCSADKAREILGYEPRIGLIEGLEPMIRHIVNVGPRPFKYHLDLEIRNEKTPQTWSERLF